MNISKLIEKLEEVKAKHGDVECTAFQHEEEDERIRGISSLFFDEDEKTLHIM